MKHIIKKLTVSLTAAAVISAMPLTVSATTAEDVVAAARNADFQEYYVQTLDNFLKGNTFTSEQYDIMIDAIYSAEENEQLNKEAQYRFHVSIPDMKNNSKTKTNDNNDTSALPDDLKKGLDKANAAHSDADIQKILDKFVDAGKKIGVEVSVEKKGEKNYIVTVKDKDGNVLLVTPVGKLVDTTGNITPSLAFILGGYAGSLTTLL